MHDWLQAAARRRPDHAALVADDETSTYAELDAAASRTARRLAAQGVAAGDRVATTLPPGLAFVELVHALPRLGAVLVPLDTRLTDAERGRLVAASGARLVVADPPGAEEADVPLRRRISADDVHSIVFTSGTTGAPKPVELTYRNHEASAAASAEHLGVAPGDRWLCPLPLFHVGGLAVLLRSAISATTAIVHDGFDAERVRRSLESGEATLASLVPTMLRRLRDAGLREAPALRAALLGGGPVPRDLLDWAAARGLPVLPTYGMTEAASQVATASPGDPRGGARPLPGVELRIAESGEVLVRGPMVAPGALGGDGWLHTGDRGRLDREGRLHVEGRLQNVIVTGGENVAAEQVESVLLDHPAVADAAVVGLPDPEWGEAVSAFVVLAGPATVEEVLGHCRHRLAPYKVPKRVEQVPALPRNAAGKLLRDEIAPARGSTGLSRPRSTGRR